MSKNKLIKKNELLERVNELLSFEIDKKIQVHCILIGLQKGLGSLSDTEKVLLKWEKDMENDSLLKNVEL